MNQFSGWFLCVLTVFSIYTGYSNGTPLSAQAKVFGISSKKAVNNDLKPVAQQIFDARASRNEFSVQKPFQVIRNNESFRSGVQNATVLQLNQADVENMLQSRHDYIELQLEDAAGKTWEMDLYRTSSVSNDFVVTTSGSNGNPIFLDGGIYYRGIIKGDYNSVAAFSIFDGNIIGMITSDEGNMVLHPVEEDNSFIFYNDRDLNAEMPFTCGTDQLEWSGPENPEEEGVNSRALSDCVRVYIECDYELYQNKGSNVTNVVNWITAVYNNVATLYANESINTAISEVFVWTSEDPYSESSASTALNQFRNLRTNFNGDLAHLASLGGNNLGGIAWVNALCTNFEYAYSNISSSYQGVPTYSWTVMVMTHEMGHNLGSNHTQWCGWSGGALDNCYPVEGSCSPGPAPVGGGTLMSYCHLTNYGINFNNGFGTQPGNKIRSRVSAVTCLSPNCTSQGGGEGGTCGTPGGLSSSNITTTTATVTWNSVSGASSYIFQYKLASSSIWSQTTLNGTIANFTSLTPATSYNCRIQAVCPGGNSTFSTILTFTTLGGTTCNVPSGLSTSNITVSSAAISWAAVSGAVSYNVQYKLSTSSVWTEINITGTSVTISSLLANTVYNWRVQAVCAGGTSSLSSFLSFTTLNVVPCNAPGGLQSSGITTTSVNLNWTSVLGATSYIVEYKLASASIWSQQNANTNNATISSLTPNSVYNWRVKTVCVSNSSANSATSNFTTLNEPSCTAPTGLNSSNITATTANLSWTAVNGATAYVVEYKLNSSGIWSQQNASSNSISLSSLIPNSVYNWRVQTVCGSNSSSLSSVSNFTTSTAASCNPPTGLTASNITANSVSLNWSAVSGANSYIVEYKLSSSGNWSQVTAPGNSTSLSSLLSNSQYDWRVQTVCGSNSSALSSVSNFTTSAAPSCNPPTGLTASNITSNSVTLNWSAVSGASSYIVEYKLSSSGNWSQVTASVNSTSLSALLSNSSYDWRVQTVCGSNSSGLSSVSTFTTLVGGACNAPSNLNSTNVTSSSASLTWSAVNGASSYNVEYKISSASNWTSISASTNSINISGLSPNSQYSWRVQSVCGGSSSVFSFQSSFRTTAGGGSCGTPIGLSSSNITASSATVSWNAVSGAVSYNVEYKLSSSSNWTQLNVTGTSTNLSSLVSNSTYNVRVQAICSGGSSANSSVLNFTTLNQSSACNAPVGLGSSNITSSSATVSWGAVSGAVSYNVEYKLASLSTWSQTNVSGTSITLTSLIANSIYNVRVQTVCNSNSSAFSTTLNFTTLNSSSACNVPGGLSASNISTTQAQISWSAVTGAVSYTLEYKLASVSTWIPVSVTGTSHNLSSLIPNSNYNYRVKTICASNSSAFSASFNFTTEQEQSGTGYCSSSGDNASIEWISRVSVGVINRISGSDGGYFDATSMSSSVPRGRSQNFIHRASFSGAPRTLYWRMWMDLNQDGDFNDAGELLASIVSSSSTDQYNSFLIPNSATLGLTRMRIQAKYSAYGNPCETFANGEVEDYTINITDLFGLPAEGENQESNIINEIKMFPNPVGEDLNLTFNATENLDLNIKIVDLFGRVLKDEEFHALEGDNRFSITVADLISGPYVLILKSGNVIQNYRFIKSE
jgi:hypothetical protein